MKNIEVREPWYAVKSIFHHYKERTFEERVVLIRADSEEEARNKARHEAQDYVSNLGDVELLEYAEVYHIADDTIEDDTEIFAWLRYSELTNDQYLLRFYKTGDEIVGNEHESL